ncbi:hypothetical protein WJ0W_003295 [Paenibacillus melissococcoides]|uniref:Bacteriophage SP-beta YorD domain-containing protein n=1 Tax=Paenibacillus melissococcoides TaxID=2912268 RepID=A0ABM9G376_9BACL|nr:MULTISPECIES: hypothetical protein [Paenibacillus]MEB9893269.1 hypothetical protein [Bacillus cereus]QVQ56260.1 hypothetical protein [Paenibacillus phage Pd_22F]CAH8246058.1 hypothetical protein WJ0W_003295 [Paenibacillus melissococcoides]CAH8712850.1 hypothetical protein WDD9_003374 [Paenibacillus melissococcoides]CAH8713616.1 hypothetical protein HTL2_003677 [Paenibacillus melissococcoides]
MIGLKIINVVPERSGNLDYKGLDINLFVAGSQIYPPGTRDCYVITAQVDIPKHEDIHLVTEAEYEAAYNAERERQQEPGPIEQLKAENEELRKQLDALQLAVMGMMDTPGGNA